MSNSSKFMYLECLTYKSIEFYLQGVTMIKLLPILLILLTTFPNTSFGGKEKNPKGSKVSVYLTNRELSKKELIQDEVQEMCGEVFLERVEITDTECSMYSINITDDEREEVILKYESFTPCIKPKGKVVLNIHPWLPTVGRFKVYVTKVSDEDRIEYERGDTSELNEVEVVNFKFFKNPFGVCD